MQTNFGATLATETFLTGEEALIAVAAAEAVALAKVAVEVAKEAAVMLTTNTSKKLDNHESFPSKAVFFLIERAKLTEIEHVETSSHSATTETQLGEENIHQSSTKDAEDSDERDSELELLQMQLSGSITARSGRRTERRARRERAAEKAVANVVSVNPQSSGRKMRSSMQQIDYSDPLHYLRGTTSTTKLLTSTEELELSEGIQVRLSTAITNS